MSKRIVDDPSLHGWIDDNGKWVWGGGADNEHPIVDGDTEGQVTTWDGAKWTPDSSVIVSGGNVGIGTSTSLTSGLDVSTAGSELSPSGAKITGRFSLGDIKNTSVMIGANTADPNPHGVIAGANALGFYTYDSGWFNRLTIDPKGDATFSGKVVVTNVGSASNSCGIRFSGASGGGSSIRIVPTDTSSVTDAVVDLGSASGRFKDAHFSGTVDAGTFNASLYRFADHGHGFAGVYANAITPLKAGGGSVTNEIDLGTSQFRWKNAYFTGTVDAAGFTINGSPIGGGGGLPDGGYTYGWNITAADFIATSDERVKDNITTAPVGLIDSLKGREWEWKESGEKGSGVVAQELEEVLPHLVHTDDEGMKSVAYNGLVAYLIEELKDCRQRIADLENRL